MQWQDLNLLQILLKLSVFKHLINLTDAKNGKINKKKIEHRRNK